MEFHFLTLFPEVLSPFLESSLLGKACQKRLVSFHLTQIRDFSKDKHKKVDDAPYGGGPGMILKADILHAAWKSVCPVPSRGVKTILLSPQGPLFNQKKAHEFSKLKKLILVSGHYEGVDERFTKLCVDEEVSIGNYILTGGELPTLVLADAVCRLIPGVLGNPKSVKEESLERGLLKYPQYTRPPEFLGLKIPKILLSGDHGKILEWREKQSKLRTRKKRPDLGDQK